MAQETEEPSNQTGLMKASWTSNETEKLVDYLHQHHSEWTDGGNFKDSTYGAAAVYLQPFYHKGKVKDVKGIKYRWGQLKHTYTLICTWHRLSGAHWDNVRGANIEGPAASVMFDAFIDARKGNTGMKEFWTSGWKYLESMEEIFPEGGTTGVHAFCGGAPSTLPSSAHDTGSCELSPSASLLGISLPTATGSGDLHNIDPQLINNAITSTVTAISSLTPLTSSPSPMLIQSQSTSISHKHPMLAMSPDELGASTGNSLLFSSTCPPVSMASTSLQPSSKQSCTSGASQVVTSSGKQKNATTIALHAMDSSIHHLKDSMTDIFVDPLKSI
ncbi:hypothetical protein J3A83DRAFT_4375082 [Scleroderma citrinum]